MTGVGLRRPSRVTGGSQGRDLHESENAAFRERILAKVIPEPNSGCWLWLGTTSGHGYAQLSVNGEMTLAYRLTHQAFLGAIPEGMLLNRKCGVRLCLNPDHMRLVTEAEHLAEAKKKRRSRPKPPHRDELDWNALAEMVRERLLAHSMPEPNSGCWLWTGYADKDGYGYTRIATHNFRAHRASYIVFRGDIPEGMRACHKCDNAGCINPDHIFLGTDADNIADKIRKGRHRGGGNAAGNAKLNASEVLRIRTESGTHRDIGDKYGVKESTVSLIKRGKTWRHLLGAAQ